MKRILKAHKKLAHHFKTSIIYLRLKFQNNNFLFKDKNLELFLLFISFLKNINTDHMFDNFYVFITCPE